MTCTITRCDKYTIAAGHPDVIERLAAKSVDNGSGCIEWLAARTANGYGVLTVDKLMLYAHRLAYTVRFGTIPDGLVVDHICRNRACINTEHLRLLTLVENSARNTAAERTHCPHGHEYTPDNTYVSVDQKGREHRNCIACRRVRTRLFMLAQRAAQKH